MDLGTGELTYKNGTTVITGTFPGVGLPDTKGAYNFTSFYLGTGITLSFKADRLNRPVQFLTQLDATILGTFNVNGSNAIGIAGGAGGPGGYTGGSGGTSSTTAGSPGAGPLGGDGGASTSIYPKGGGLFKANQQLIPLYGGSGGGGGFGGNGANGGGGGGGALLLASSGTITITGSINAKGGESSASGSGGAVRLIANTITGTGAINVSYGPCGYYSSTYCGSSGYVRTEATQNLHTNISGTSDYSRTTTPTAAFPATGVPSIRVSSINASGTTVTLSNGTGGLVTPPDVTLPSFQTSIVVNVVATNVPGNTPFTVRVAPVDGTSNIYKATTYPGTLDVTGKTGSVTITTLPAGTSVINVFSTFLAP
ncbi:hypothetical protein [Candidatus Cyanaurora vandensis]|uniref:hypothetical protein n=1 Tax=Candidatus Cyanaurora vandensis TaxID=2714958 RepID=UPI00257F4F8A|nr:hypothetical protein [Candidatus Cyanaurora vandensis]